MGRDLLSESMNTLLNVVFYSTVMAIIYFTSWGIHDMGEQIGFDRGVSQSYEQGRKAGFDAGQIKGFSDGYRQAGLDAAQAPQAVVTTTTTVEVIAVEQQPQQQQETHRIARALAALGLD